MPAAAASHEDGNQCCCPTADGRGPRRYYSPRHCEITSYSRASPIETFYAGDKRQFSVYAACDRCKQSIGRTFTGQHTFAGVRSTHRVRETLLTDMSKADAAGQETSQLSLLHRTSRIVSSGLMLEGILEELIKITGEVTQCDACLVYLPDESTGDVVLRASQLPHRTEMGKLRLKKGEGVTGWVAEHKTVVALSCQAAIDHRFRSFSALVEDTYEAFLSVPLISGGEVIGVLNVHHKEPHSHTPTEIALLSFVGEQMGSAITMSRLAERNARLREEADEIRQQLETRKMVERAKGILQRMYGLTEEEAYQRLRNESRRLRRPVRELAEAILLVESLGQESPATERSK